MRFVSTSFEAIKYSLPREITLLFSLMLVNHGKKIREASENAACPFCSEAIPYSNLEAHYNLHSQKVKVSLPFSLDPLWGVYASILDKVCIF